MATETTFSIIKPNAVKKNAIGSIIQMFEKNGLKIAAMKLTKIDKAKCELFYEEHKARPFFGELVSFMTSGPVDPKKAEPGTIRALFGDSVGENAVHGSDSTTSAERELKIFFETHEFANS